MSLTLKTNAVGSSSSLSIFFPCRVNGFSTLQRSPCILFSFFSFEAVSSVQKRDHHPSQQSVYTCLQSLHPTSLLFSENSLIFALNPNTLHAEKEEGPGLPTEPANSGFPGFDFSSFESIANKFENVVPELSPLDLFGYGIHAVDMLNVLLLPVVSLPFVASQKRVGCIFLALKSVLL